MGGAGLTIVSTIIVIGVLVFVHELGHFLAAKWAGIYVHRFSLGLGGPVKWLSFRRGETEYAVSWVPLGGYVKMASRMEDATGDALEGGAASVAEVPPDRVFEAKPVWVRMVVILAGVAMNVVFAWVLFSGLLYFGGIPVLATTDVAEVDRAKLPPGAAALGGLVLGDRIVAVEGDSVTTWQALERAVVRVRGDTIRLGIAGRQPVTMVAPMGSADRLTALRAIRPHFPPVIGEVVAGHPGAKAGFKEGDTIVAFEGRAVREWRELVSQIETKAGQEVTVDVGRVSGRTRIQVTPAAEQDSAPGGGVRTVGRIGIRGPAIPDVREPIGLIPAMVESARRVGYVATAVVGLVRGMFNGTVSTRDLGGPISIGMAAGESARRGPEEFLGLMALLSVNLAILNLLPIPILDGGQFLFLLAEAITRRPVTGRVREWLTMAGFVAILMLMVLAFSNDIRRLLERIGVLG